MGSIKSPWVSDGIKARSKGHAVYRAHVNREAGECGRCKGIGKIIWSGTTSVSECYSCNGKGQQTDADIARNAEYNRKLDEKIESARSATTNDAKLRKSKNRRPQYDDPEYSRSHVLTYADQLRRRQTATERRFASFLDQMDGGKWKGKYKCQHAFSGKWIADFYIPSCRLVIEIDGQSHISPEQAKRDQLKEEAALTLDILMVRFTNDEVWSDLAGVNKALINAIEEATLRITTTVSPYGLPYSTNFSAKSSEFRGSPAIDSSREWKDLPDYAPKVPTPDESMSEKYRSMEFSAASAINGVQLIRQCLNPRCNFESIVSLTQALEKNLILPTWTSDTLEAKSICSKCRSRFVLVRLGSTKSSLKGP